MAPAQASKNAFMAVLRKRSAAPEGYMSAPAGYNNISFDRQRIVQSNGGADRPHAEGCLAIG
jgi:hypothetical protein